MKSIFKSLSLFFLIFSIFIGCDKNGTYTGPTLGLKFVNAQGQTIDNLELDYNTETIIYVRTVPENAIDNKFTLYLRPANEDEDPEEFTIDNVNKKVTATDYGVIARLYAKLDSNPNLIESSDLVLWVAKKPSNFDLDEYKTMMQTMNMVPVEGDTFLMGEGDGVNVTLSDYYICDHEVTQAEYETIIGSNPSCNGCGDGNNPVDSVSWYDSIVYCNKLSIANNLTPCYAIGEETDPDNWGGAVPTESDTTWNTVTCDFNANGFRLPTEAEWEFAARGGNDSEGYIFAGGGNSDIETTVDSWCEALDPIAWFVGNSNNVTHTVKTKLPNELGIYDMSGNVVEWCWDWYSESLAASNDTTDPVGPETGSKRVNRGGSIKQLKVINMAGLNLLKAINHSMITQAVPQQTGHGLGFRVARSCR